MTASSRAEHDDYNIISQDEYDTDNGSPKMSMTTTHEMSVMTTTTWLLDCLQSPPYLE